jgi:hypothetical protein
MKRPFWRGWLGMGANLVSNLFLDKPLPLRTTTFCAFHRQLCAHLDPALDHQLPIATALVQAASETRAVPVHLNPSVRGGSRYTMRALSRLFLSRSSYYRISRVLVMFAAVSLAMVASFCVFAQDTASWPILIPASAALSAICLLLARLAFRVQRKTAPVDLLRANRSA